MFKLNNEERIEFYMGATAILLLAGVVCCVVHYVGTSRSAARFQRVYFSEIRETPTKRSRTTYHVLANGEWLKYRLDWEKDTEGRLQLPAVGPYSEAGKMTADQLRAIQVQIDSKDADIFGWGDRQIGTLDPTKIRCYLEVDSKTCRLDGVPDRGFSGGTNITAHAHSISDPITLKFGRIVRAIEEGCGQKQPTENPEKAP